MKLITQRSCVKSKNLINRLRYAQSVFFYTINMSSQRPTSKLRMQSGRPQLRVDDIVAIEEPLAIKVNGIHFATLMRTPGREHDLAAGFLAAEAVIDGVDEIAAFKKCDTENTVNVALADGCNFDLSKQRLTTTSSSCGVCGSRSIDELKKALDFKSVQLVEDLEVDELLAAMQQMQQQQQLFAETAATHAVALYSLNSKHIIDIAEDVGRHNAADKVIGQQLLAGNYPISEALVLLLSGRVSFDMIQKAACANIGAICAVGMPTSLAIESAQAVGMKLYAWAREDSVCLY